MGQHESNLCEVKPISAFQSTNLNSKIESFQALGQRILYSLGHPSINIEVHPEALYENISLATEFFTKFAGYTEENIVFDSRLYEKNVGIRLDHLFTVANTNFTQSQRMHKDPKPTNNPDYPIDNTNQYYIALSALSQDVFSTSPTLSSVIPEQGIYKMDIIGSDIVDDILSFNPALSSSFQLAAQPSFTKQAEEVDDVESYNNAFDYDLMEYRKVIAVKDFEEGSSTGVNTLFTLEQTLAQQTYFSYAMGNFGFDLVTWNTMKEWQETREKVLAIRKEVSFDQRTQYMRLYPQPKQGTRYWGCITCYVERPLSHIIKEPWVYQYALALTKITWGRILTKISNVSLPGSGTLNGELVLNEGLEEKRRLEELMLEGPSAGFGDSDPIGLYIG